MGIFDNTSGVFNDKCPVCRSENFQLMTTTINGDLNIHECLCDECGSEWEEVWAFVEDKITKNTRN